MQLDDDCSKVHNLTCLFQDSSKCCHILLKINITQIGFYIKLYF